jgi:integrase
MLRPFDRPNSKPSITMSGRRNLTPAEERALIRTVRKLPARDRALITTQLFGGYRSFEVLSLTVRQVWRNNRVATAIGITPKNRKGHHGNTHWVPVGNELRRALENYISRRLEDENHLPPGAPLFVSRKRAQNGRPQALDRRSALRIVRDAFVRANIEDDGRLGTHTLRKTYAQKVFHFSGNNLLIARDALGHASCATTEIYLQTSRDEVEAAILRGDWTRRPRKSRTI